MIFDLTRLVWCSQIDQTLFMSGESLTNHTIQKSKKIAGKNTFQILLLNDANMIGKHQETNYMHRIKTFRNCQFGTFDPVHGI